MNLKIFALMLCVIPGLAYSATRGAGTVDAAGRASRATSRGGTSATVPGAVGTKTASAHATTSASGGDSSGSAVAGGDCGAAYRDCMDRFCLRDAEEGSRCICSDNINAAEKLLARVKETQAEADRLYSIESEKAKLGAKADMVFDSDENNTKKSTSAGYDDDEDEEEYDLDSDEDRGDALYEIAHEACAVYLDSCATQNQAKMEETLYSRSIVNDCKSFKTYLDEQQTYAEQNKSAANMAVAMSRLEVLDTTNKYNRGECLLAYRACISNKGGCGVHFENCLDAKLLNRRAKACDNILDQCMAVRKDVEQDWKEEAKDIIAEATKYSEKNFVNTCLAQIQLCLEENCSIQTDSACLTDVKVAQGICPIIGECEAKIPGITQTKVVNQLANLRRKFCENDVEACLKDKCGTDFTAPQCLGKTPHTIASTLCPITDFTNCKDSTQYNTIVSSILLQMDYNQIEGCKNYFSEQLGAVCGMDMNCLPDSTLVAGLDKMLSSGDYELFQARVRQEAKDAVDKFFVDFEKDKTIDACKSAEDVSKKSLGDIIFNGAKQIAYIGAENRALRQLSLKIAELSRALSLEEAKNTCLTLYQPEDPKDTKESYSYISSVVFEPDLRNCHVCRMQQVCETGGEKKSTSALKAAAGGLTAGAAMGTQINAGWGTAIGGIIGAVGAGALGAASGGQETFCQQIESCEDINMGEGARK